MIRPAITVFVVLTLMLASACALFGVQERADIIDMAEQQKVEWHDAYKHRQVTREQLEAALSRLDNVIAAARDEGTRDLMLDIGLGLGGVLLGAKGKKAAQAVGSAIRRHRTTTPAKGKG